MKNIVYFFKNAWHEELAENMMISGICRLLSMIISFMYVPIALNYLGVEKYGVWATILSIISWIGFFDIGIGNGLRNKLTASITNNETEISRKLVSSTYAVIAVLMIVITIIFCIGASLVNWNIVFGVNNFTENIFAVVALSGIFMAVNFVLSICKNILYALQKAGQVSALELTTQLLNLVGVLLLTNILPGNLFMMALVYGLSMTASNIFYSIILYKKNRELRPALNKIDISVGKGITKLGVRFFTIQICALVLFTTDSLLISYLYGASDVTPYNTVNKLYSVISGLHTALLAPIWSATTKAKVGCGWDYLRKIIKKLYILVLPFWGIAIVLLLVFKPLAGWWLGQRLDYSSGIIGIGCLYCILIIWCNTIAQVSNGLELLKVSILVAGVQAIVNIPLSLLFAVKLNMESAGVLLGTVCSMTISAIVLPLAVHIYINKSITLKQVNQYERT